jgi:hypothetical protein
MPRVRYINYELQEQISKKHKELEAAGLLTTDIIYEDAVRLGANNTHHIRQSSTGHRYITKNHLGTYQFKIRRKNKSFCFTSKLLEECIKAKESYFEPRQEN